jgi:hypothetical protein
MNKLATGQKFIKFCNPLVSSASSAAAAAAAAAAAYHHHMILPHHIVIISLTSSYTFCIVADLILVFKKINREQLCKTNVRIRWGWM